MAGKGSRRSWRLTVFLITLNVLVLAAGLALSFYLASRPSGLTELNPSKIRFWSQPADYRPDPAPTAQPDLAAAAKVPEQNAAPTPTRLCIELTGIDQARYDTIRGQLKTAGLDNGVCRFNFDKKLGWWVYWPPEYETARREKAIRAIQAAGVKDVMPITQGAMAQSYSLGVFSGENQANQYRDFLRGKGLAKVQFGPRPNLAWARLGCAVADQAKQEGFKAGLPGWAKPVEADKCPADGAVAAPKPKPR